MIFTLLICCFLGLGALQPSCVAPRLNENNVVEVETKKHNNMIFDNSSSSAWIFAQELASNDFVLGMFDYICSLGDDYNNDFFIHTQSGWNHFQGGHDYYFYLGGSLTNYSLVSKYDYQSGLIDAYYTYPHQKYEWCYLTTLRITTDVANNNLHNYRFIYTDKDGHVMLDYDINLGITNPQVMQQTTGYVVGNVFYQSSLMSGTDYRFVCLSIWKNSFLYNAYDFIHNSVSEVSYNQGYENGYSNGLYYGERNPNQSTYDAIYSLGEQTGYAQGLNDGQANSGVAQTIFAGCVEVGLLPVNVFLKMFEYEVFGINIAGFVSALMTIAIVIIIIRMVTGGKNDK